MTFKDIAEARKVINMYAFLNGYGLEQLKSDPTRLRYICEASCPFRVARKIKVREMRASLKAAFNVNVSEAKRKRAKRLILESLEGSFTNEYNKLVAYVNELKFSNLGSDVIVNLSKDALAEGLDGTFLKGKVKGQLLVAGMIDSISGVLPEAHPRFCVRHTEANWCKRWGSGEYKKYLWWAAWSTYEEDFQDQLNSMRQVDDDGKAVIEDLLKYPPTCWNRSFFDTTCKNQSVDNNLTRSFNAWILQVRHKPIIKMLKEIRIKVMNMLTDNEAEWWGGEVNTVPRL
ncbi:uncharacterized protein [Nicotiana tomentosiformis]|uniref:uncharacterized protein n=1 Tax=Nicotiana tomentosiformis TaxID=4098 RepID=UPI00388CA0CB